MQLVEFGASPRFELRELPDPEPVTGEVAVGVVTAGLNRRSPWIWQTRIAVACRSCSARAPPGRWP
jgi:NADPH:quinone reductase-like Zn-dependent oxidoreductase